MADRLTRRFGEGYAVNQATFAIPWGSNFGYVGPSGSGKTTTIKLLLGLLRPTEGKATVLGLPLESFDKETRRRIGYTPQFFALYPGLTLRQNLHFAGRIYGISRGRRARITRLLPATYGIAFSRDIMLRGAGPETSYLWSVLGLSALLTVLAWLFIGRRLRRA